MSLTIRPATPVDIDALASMFDGYRRFYGQPSNLIRAHDFVAERLSRNEAHVLLAEFDGAAVGFALLYPGFSSVHTARVWTLNDLFVVPDARQRGAGRALLEACEAFGRSEGALRLQLETHRTNTVAQALYIELGWESEDENQWYHLPLERNG